jgi:hypothetical protein
MHQVVSTHAVAFDAWMVPELCQMLHEVVVNLGTRISLADYEASVAQTFPRDLTLSRQFMISRQCHVHPLVPQMGYLAAIRDRLASQEGDIQVMTPNRCDVTGRSALNELRANSRIRHDESAKKISEEAGREGREYSDANNTHLATRG